MRQSTNLFFIFILIFIALSCDKNTGNPVINDSCSSINLSGTCKDDKSCVNGKCVYECQESLDCPNSSYHCDNNICYNTEESCSSKNYFGKCAENETCVEGVCKDLNPCSREFPNGICSSDTRFCYEGICVDETNECKPWNKHGICPLNYSCVDGSCVHKKDNYPCSLQSPNGACTFDTDICINGFCLNKEGTCGGGDPETDRNCPSGQDCENSICTFDENKLCSLDYLFGYCKNSKEKCYNGVCYNLDDNCSVDNPFGKCPENMICDFDGSCNLLFVECDENNACPDLDRQYCDNNKCVDKPIFCEDGALDGLCPEKESCVNSQCESITVECSESNLYGTCKALNLKCINGDCLDSSQEGVCSSFELNGECPENQICNNGLCLGDINPLNIGNACIIDAQCEADLYCEKTFLDGYCTKTCNDNSECTSDSTCYKVSSSIGYCLTKCSVNIPNSCSRAGQEDYICNSVDGNDGVCLYDCKYHNCFETGRTCNQITGICE
jgi:hypothetical protein